MRWNLNDVSGSSIVTHPLSCPMFWREQSAVCNTNERLYTLCIVNR